MVKRAGEWCELGTSGVLKITFELQVEILLESRPGRLSLVIGNRHGTAYSVPFEWVASRKVCAK